MREDDIESLVAHFCFSWSTVEATREKWMKYCDEHRNNVRAVAVIEKDHLIVGYGSLLRKSKYPHFSHIPEIHDLWVAEEHRRIGLGKLLLAHLENLARKEGYQKVGIGVGLYRDYGPAQRLYKSNGF